MDKTATLPIMLTIAGSDSGGGAGIQADIRVATALEVFPISVITAVTAQNTIDVTDVYPIPSDIVSAQLDAVITDMQPNAVKIGMLVNEQIAREVSRKLSQYKLSNIIVDPVGISTSGTPLYENATEWQRVLIEKIFPLATIVTPNIPEAENLLNMHITTLEETKNAARLFTQQFNCSAILLKGGHGVDSDVCTDVLYEKSIDRYTLFPHKRIQTFNLHGTGCSLSSAIASYLALGLELRDAVEKGIGFLQNAINISKDIRLGRGNGPVVTNIYK